MLPSHGNQGTSREDTRPKADDGAGCGPFAWGCAASPVPPGVGPAQPFGTGWAALGRRGAASLWNHPRSGEQTWRWARSASAAAFPGELPMEHRPPLLDVGTQSWEQRVRDHPLVPAASLVAELSRTVPCGGGTCSEVASSVGTCRSPPHPWEGERDGPLSTASQPDPAAFGCSGAAWPTSPGYSSCSCCELLAVTSMGRTSCLERLCSLLLWAFVTVIFLPVFSLGDVGV